MAVVLVQDFSGAGLSGRLQPNHDALRRMETHKREQPSEAYGVK